MKLKDYVAYYHSPKTFEQVQEEAIKADGLLTAMSIAYHRAKEINAYVAAIMEQKK